MEQLRWEAPSLPLSRVLEVDVMRAEARFWGNADYAGSHACDGDTGCSRGQARRGGRNMWLWAIRNVTCLKCKAWSNDPFKVQADHMDWENYGTEGVKRLKGFSCYSESERHSVAPKENHTKMVAKSIATGNQGRWLLSARWWLVSKLWMGPLLYSRFLFLYQEPGWVGTRESLLTTFWIVTNELQVV